MGDLLPTGSLKRDEIYSFLGGLFIACSWSLYFQKLGLLLLSDGSSWSTEITFVLTWLFSTALLFIFQLVMTFVTTKLVLCCLQKKQPEELQKILGFKDPIRDFIFLDYFESLLSSAHIINVVFLSFLISAYPFKIISQNYFGVNVSCGGALVFTGSCTLLFYFYIIIYRQYLAIIQLRSLARLDFIDKKKYTEEIAVWSAELAKQAVITKINAHNQP